MRYLFNILLRTHKAVVSRTSQFSLFNIKPLTSKTVRLVEVGPRDGLQNEKAFISTNTKVDFINKLSKTGIESIEVSSFVHPNWVPQLSDSTEVFNRIDRNKEINYSALVPNKIGLLNAIKVNPSSVAVFVSASETFSKRNINCTIEESLQRLDEVFEIAKKRKLPVRGYISCVVGCPYEGNVDYLNVAKLTKILWEKGCYEISLGDTIGVGTPESIDNLLSVVLRQMKACPPEALAIHCHDTNGNALANISIALDNHDIRIVDSCVAGLGGCPYAGPGVPGNVATEAVIAHLLNTGYQFTKPVNLDEIIKIGKWIREEIAAAKLKSSVL